MKSVKEFYRNRFKGEELNHKYKRWKILCEWIFQKIIDKNDTLMDLGAGYCEFINNINCKVKIAVDINEDTVKMANKNVQVLNINLLALPKSFNEKIDVIFISNLLEHLNSKSEVILVLEKANKLLRKRGKIILLQPNIDLVKEKYWDFIDHNIPLNLHSLNEALEITGFEIKLKIKRFLPYTTKSRFAILPDSLLKLYLLLPPNLRPFAGQSLIIAEKFI